MRIKVYAETNLILEVAFQQEEASQCRDLLGMAEAGHLTLLIPAFCLYEAQDTLRRRLSEWQEQLKLSAKQLREISRIESLRDEARATEQRLRALIADAVQASEQGLDEVIPRLIAHHQILPTPADVMHMAMRDPEGSRLGLPDRVVLYSVLQSLDQAPDDTLFVTKNKNDFKTQAVEGLLRQRRCTLITSFDGCLQRVKSVIQAKT